jgi:probable phosphoglycerate mutase
METIIDLLRHGEPEGGSRYRGHGVDDPLSERGWSQMWEAVGDHCPWQVIVSSPLRRCRAFAEALAERHGLPVRVDDRFREIGFGSWEGCGREQLQHERPEEYAAFYRDPVHARPPGAEDLDAFIRRVVAGYEELVQANEGRHCLLVSHAGVMRAILAHVVQAKPAGLYRMNIANAGISRIRHRRFGPELEFMNARHPPTHP